MDGFHFLALTTVSFSVQTLSQPSQRLSISDSFVLSIESRIVEIVDVGLVHHAWNLGLRQEDNPEAEQHVSEILMIESHAGSGHRPRLLNCVVHPLGSHNWPGFWRACFGGKSAPVKIIEICRLSNLGARQIRARLRIEEADATDARACDVDHTG